TVMRERKMLDILPPSAQLIFEVSNFTRLANRVFREYGGLTYNYVTSPVKSLAVWNTLRVLSPLLREYGKQKGDLSFSEMMLSQIEEFKTYGISPVMLERAAERAEGNSRLADKLEDLSLIYATYSNFLSDYGKGDASDDIGKLAEKLSEHNYFKCFDMYIDSFMSFTASQRAVLSQIIKQAANVTAAFCSEDGGALQFDAVNRSMRNLVEIAERAGCETIFEKLTENKRTGDKALCRLGRDLWRFDAKPDEEDYNTGSVELIKCTNVYEEAETVCGAISKLVMGGMRYRDIVIIAGNAKNYEGIIDSALEKAEIPYFMSKSTNVTSMPLAKLLLCAFRIKNKGWRTEDVITYIKTGLCGVPMRDADLFEQYIWKWSISGSAFLGEEWTMDPDSYSAKVSERNVDTLDTVNRCRSALTAPLVTLFDKVDAAETNVDICRAVFEYMQELKISDQLRSFAEDTSLRGNKAEASEARRLYNTVLDVLEILAELDCGTERYDSAEFEQALNIVLSE
ncbi:MAG: hypothetical protein IKU19_03980, partial [Clostridia bacterium]|nr:hypothetical protein [Clostridia bacterium]